MNKKIFVFLVSAIMLIFGYFVVQASSLTSINFVSPSGSITGSTYTGTAGTASYAATAGTATNATNATNATWGTYLNSPDGNRSDVMAPTTMARSLRFDFKNGAVLGGTIGNYIGLMTYSPWDGTSASTGDSSYQLAFGSTVANGGNPRLAIRNGIDSTWNAWKEIITSANIGSQSVSYAATAGSATNATNATYATYLAADGSNCAAGSYPLGVDTQGNAQVCTPAATGGLGGSGTVNYVPKWTSGSALGNSVIYDNGTNVGVGTTNPSSTLAVNGTITGTNLTIPAAAGTPASSGIITLAGTSSSYGSANQTIQNVISANASALTFNLTYGGSTNGNGKNTVRFNGENTGIEAVNSNDSLGLRFMETYTTGYVGLVNTGGSSNGSVPANGWMMSMALANNGKVGSIVPLTSKAAPTWRNVLDDGSGNMTITGNVGIGINPGYKLDVNGAGNFNSNQIHGVATPGVNTDAANKLYVDSTVSGGSVSNADMTDGLHAAPGRNNVANQLVRTDASGYIQAGYINSSYGNENNNSNADRVWGTNGGDDYLRTYRTSALSVSYAATAGSATNATNATNATYLAADGSNCSAGYYPLGVDNQGNAQSCTLAAAGGGGSQTPWTSAINAAGYTLNGNSTASGKLTLDSTSDATKGYVLINPTGGNVGIGTTAPGAKLDVSSGDIRINRGQNIGAYFANHTNVGTVNTGFGNYIGSSFTGMQVNTIWDGIYDDEILTFSTHDGGLSVGERMRIDKSGNVGIGTTNPVDLLSLGQTGTKLGVLSLAGSTSGKVTVKPAAAAGTWTLTLPTTVGTAGYFLQTNGAGVTTWAAAGGGGSQTPWASHINAAGYTLNGNSTASGKLTLDSTSDATKGYVLINPTGGNVGIGTTAPNALFQVGAAFKVTTGGIAYNTDSTRWLDMTGTLSDSLIVSNDIHSTAGELKADGTGNSYVMGNMGVGTTNPGGPLHVQNNAAGADAIRLGTTGTGANQPVDIHLGDSNAKGIRIYASINELTAQPAGAGFQLYSNASTNFPGQVYFDSGAHASAALIFRTAPASTDITERMRISSNGYVGIGTTAPGGPLEVSVNTDAHQEGVARFFNRGAATAGRATSIFIGKSAVDGGAANIGYFSDTVTPANSRIYLSHYTHGESVSIINNGNVGIGTAAPGAKLEIYTGTGTSGLKTGLICSSSTASKLYTDSSGNVICGTDQTGGGSGNIVDTLAATLGAGNNAGGLNMINLGNVGIGTTNPVDLLSLGQTGTKLGVLSLAGSTSGKVIVQPAAAAGTWTLTLPTTVGTVGYFLQTNGAGVTTWAAAGGGGHNAVTLTTIGAVANANGATLVDQVLNLQPASATLGGVVTSGNQTFGGVKTFNSQITGSISGTATALASNPNNCLPGNYPLGIDASGNAEFCTAAGGGGGGASYWTLNGSQLYATSTSYNVGIGTTNPGLYKLYVQGDANITGTLAVNKLTVNTVDPLYRIKGVNYSTFGASISGGVKEEYVGRIRVDRETVIDFDKVAKGSDLWVWRQVVDFSPDNVEVLLTPYGGFAQTYYLIEGNKLIFRSDRSTDLSYRLIGKRFDWKKWPTLAEDQTTIGLEIK